jgi:hypothetical protein
MRRTRSPLTLVGAEPQPDIHLDLDGSPLLAKPGQSLAAALLAAGYRSWRTGTRGAGPERARGLFCGIGVCFDCLVTVNGRPDQRACLVVPKTGDQVRTQALRVGGVDE